MKTLAMIAAAAAAMFAIPAASAAPVAAPAPTAVTATALADSTQVRVVVRDDRRGYRGDRRRGYRGDRRRHNVRRSYNRRVCTNEWRRGHRVRICRTVRSWRR